MKKKKKRRWITNYKVDCGDNEGVHVPRFSQINCLICSNLIRNVRSGGVGTPPRKQDITLFFASYYCTLSHIVSSFGAHQSTKIARLLFLCIEMGN